jgi:hypothetical protein
VNLLNWVRFPNPHLGWLFNKNIKSKGRIFLVKIQKEEFLEMLKLGILKTDRNNKSFSITCKKKGNPKRKKYYVCELDYRKYKKSNKLPLKKP